MSLRVTKTLFWVLVNDETLKKSHGQPARSERQFSDVN